MNNFFKRVGMCRLIRSQKGITLVEVMAAMVVLSIGILAMAPMVVLSIQGSGEASDLTEATMQAQTTLENLTRMDPLPTLPYTNTIIDSTSGLTRLVRIDNSASNPSVPAGMNRFEVKVAWTDKAGVDRVFEYSTLRTE